MSNSGEILYWEPAADRGRMTLVLFRTRAWMSVKAERRCGASRSKKPSEGSRWRGGRGPYAN